MNVRISIIAIAALALSSCSSIRHTSTTVDVETKVINFTVADMNVKPEKVTATTNWDFNPFKRVDVGEIKTNTTARLVNENNADVLVEPQYIIERRGFLRGGSVTVTGFPATYTNFHKMTDSEAAIITAASEATKKETKKQKKWIIF